MIFVCKLQLSGFVTFGFGTLVMTSNNAGVIEVGGLPYEHTIVLGSLLLVYLLRNLLEPTMSSRVYV